MLAHTSPQPGHAIRCSHLRSTTLRMGQPLPCSQGRRSAEKLAECASWLCRVPGGWSRGHPYHRPHAPHLDVSVADAGRCTTRSVTQRRSRRACSSPTPPSIPPLPDSMGRGCAEEDGSASDFMPGCMRQWRTVVMTVGASMLAIHTGGTHGQRRRRRPFLCPLTSRTSPRSCPCRCPSSSPCDVSSTGGQTRQRVSGRTDGGSGRGERTCASV